MGVTILIVEDNARLRVLIREIAARGHEVASHGAEAIRLTRELRPDIVLLDMSMPRVNGLEALRRIKAERPETKVIITTIHSEDAYRRAAEASGTAPISSPPTRSTSSPLMLSSTSVAIR